MDRTERSRRLQELFAAALALDARERDAWIDSLANDDAELRDELRELLEHVDSSERLFEHPAFTAPERSFAVPERIGSFRILRELGAGGMGVVYLAEQDHPRRRVALKVLLPGVASPQAIKRFEREAQVLARLQHPGIAAIYEAGTANWGRGPQPYFAMEHVEGRRLSEEVATQALGTRERIELLAQICDAVEHAHARGVIHRDLKPSNVLVEHASGQPRAKVLDFGIARVTGADLQTTSLRTDVGQLIGTLPYMSPEQAGADPEAIDGRSDVYSLGVIGYELVAGRLPLEIVGKPLHEAVRVVRDETPQPLSRAAPGLRGDLDTIFARALEKEPSRRYPSAGELAADLRRFLDDRPIVARPASRAYVLAKFARRNRWLVGGVIGTLAALLVGLLSTWHQASVAAAARDRADVEARRARRVADFQREMLSREQPGDAGRDVKLIDVLDAAAKALPGDLAGDPAVEGGVRKTLGESFQSLGELERAENELALAVTRLTDGLGADHDETLRARSALCSVIADRGRFDEAAQLLERLLPAWNARHGQDERESLVLQMLLADLRSVTGHGEEAERLMRDNVERRVRALGPDDAATLTAQSLFGQLLWSHGKLDEAEPLLRRAYERARIVEGEAHPDTLRARAILASLSMQRGNLDEARSLLLATVEQAPRVFGPEHPETLAFQHNLGALYERMQEPARAEELFRDVVRVQASALGPQHPDTWAATTSLAMLLVREKRGAEAVPLLEGLLEAMERELAPDDARLASTRGWLEKARASPVEPKPAAR